MSFPILLRNGEPVNVNDHVYCSPSWSVREGTPYSIGRIMEFLGPEGAPKGTEGKYLHQTRVRLAWYYRPCDVSDRPVTDSRLLLAAIYSEICDINQLRAKCHVVHRDKITDLAGWRKRADRFYFNRLFDPYIKKEFEVIQSSDVRNLPDDVRDNLTKRYEYVVAEKEFIPDLTDSIRLCGASECTKWCPSAESVQCDRCKNFFHFKCVQPPLIAKPTRGYGWTCAPCSRKHEEEVDNHEARHTTPTATKLPKTNAPAPRGRGRPRKDRTLAEKEENMAIKYYKGWPFRYFGVYTVAEDTLDPDDLIFPRSATRSGSKFQASVDPMPNPESERRGGDGTIEVLSNVCDLSAEQLAEVESHKETLLTTPETRFSVDYLTELYRRFSNAVWLKKSLTSVDLKSPLRLEKWKKPETRFFDRPWDSEEKNAFETAILTYGAELRTVMADIGKRSMPEVVRYYGQWKSQKLGEENARIREMGAPARPVWQRYDNSSEASEGQRVGLSDDETSIVEQTSCELPSCGACRTRESEAWWKAPKGLSSDVLCDQCGTNWRKYADLNVRPMREDIVPNGKGKMADKREGTPLAGPSAKRLKGSSSASTRSTPPPNTPSLPQIRCVACQKNGPLGKVLKCRKCQFQIHAGCGGAVVKPADVEDWVCEICHNLDALEAAINSDCLLCPRPRKNGKNKSAPRTDTFLRACKPTESQGWAHILCAVFVPEISFADASRLRLVEGISSIPEHRWSKKCGSCEPKTGVVLKCSDCNVDFHGSCAWKNGHRFGFEIQPGSRRDVTPVVTFKGETGIMSPVVYCRDYDRSRRHIYDLCEANEGGETALQVYCRTYKQAQLSQAHALLRKARRLDQIISNRPDAPRPREPLIQHCHKCTTSFSPFFHPVPNIENCWLCHLCHFSASQMEEPLKEAKKEMIDVS